MGGYFLFVNDPSLGYTLLGMDPKMSDLRDVSLTCQSVPPNLQNCPCTSCTTRRLPGRIEIERLTEENKRLKEQESDSYKKLMDDFMSQSKMLNEAAMKNKSLWEQSRLWKEQLATQEAKLSIARQALEDIGHRFQRKHLADVSAMGLLGRAEGIASQALQRMEG